MPSVRVRPTLRVELKHRVMNCKIPATNNNNTHGSIDIEKLNESVLNDMRKSKRKGLGAENAQKQMMKVAQSEISKCKNLDEIRMSIEAGTSQAL